MGDLGRAKERRGALRTTLVEKPENPSKVEESNTPKEGHVLAVAQALLGYLPSVVQAAFSGSSGASVAGRILPPSIRLSFTDQAGARGRSLSAASKVTASC